MKYNSFDLEIAEELTEEKQSGLGITCAAMLSNAADKPEFVYEHPRMTQGTARKLVNMLMERWVEGFVPLTWNGTKFDFRILAEESGMFLECATLALNHVDMMLFVTFQNGYYLGLDKALVGMGLESKTHSVDLKDGTLITDMSGAKAPELWKAGETQAVLDYLDGDVRQPLALVHEIEKRHRINWVSMRGKPMTVFVPKILTVRECFDFPVPDTSWMPSAPTRSDFVSWMPEAILRETHLAAL